MPTVAVFKTKFVLELLLLLKKNAAQNECRLIVLGADLSKMRLVRDLLHS